MNVLKDFARHSGNDLNRNKISGRGRLWGPAQGLRKHYIEKTNRKNKIKGGHNRTKIGASNISGGN